MKKLIYFITLMLGVTGMKGQQLTSYNLSHLPQRSYMNPAFMPHSNVHVGIPVFSGISSSYSNNGFRYNDLFRHNSNNLLILDVGNAINQMKERNNLSIHMETELLSLGFKLGRNYLTLNATEKADANFKYSKSMFEFLYYGNAASMGTMQQLSPGLEVIHYREYGLAWAREINTFINAGLRFKYLYGMENVITKGSGLSIYTDPIDYSITANSDYTIYTSGLDTSSFNNFEVNNYAFGKRNTGYALDAGITIKLLSNFELSAAAIDLGKINWATKNSIYHTKTDNGAFIYTGINLDEFVNSDSLDATSYIEAIGDSLYETFQVTTTHESYTYKMPLQLYFSGSYLLTPKYKLTALVKNKHIYQGNLTDYHFSFTGIAKTWLNYSISLNKINKAPTTLGAGFTLNFHNDQIYFVSDNVPGLINWKKAYTTGFRAGINIMFGTKMKTPRAPQPILEDPVSSL